MNTNTIKNNSIWNSSSRFKSKNNKTNSSKSLNPSALIMNSTWKTGKMNSTILMVLLSKLTSSWKKL